MSSSLDRKRVRLYLQIGAVFLVLTLIQDLHRDAANFFARALNNVWLVCYLTVANYVLFEYTLPFIRLTWRRLLAAPFVLFGQLLVHSFGLYAWRFVGIGAGVYTSFRSFPSVEKGVEFHMSYSMLSVFLFGVIRYGHDQRQLKQAAQQLRIEKQEAELNYLRSQTNPHFLFNTLNNIYALSRDKSDRAPESILRLSKILRYMLYETDGQFVAVEKEIKIIGDYLELEKLRYDESLRIGFHHDVDDLRQALPPLLLMPLVENAFKHGVSETRHKPFVDIQLSIHQRGLRFVVKNSSEVAEGEAIRENIGLSNLRRQLELLYRDYSLAVRQGEAVFTATLTINLASHV